MKIADKKLVLQIKNLFAPQIISQTLVFQVRLPAEMNIQNILNNRKTD